MIIIGAKGFAKQIVEVFYQQKQSGELYFFDNVTGTTGTLYNHSILTRLVEVGALFAKGHNRFCLGVGGPLLRCKLASEFKELGGMLESVISPYASVASYARMKDGVSVLTGAIIENDVLIEEGVLINTHASIHHDSMIGRYCEIAPGVRILGTCVVEDFAFIGANAVILPKIKVGKNAIVGAGAVVTKNVEPNSLVVGNPAHHVRYVL
jgi:sugar O-acyltransferase (sialic acid O-acetyltransferase NeuD family)